MSVAVISLGGKQFTVTPGKIICVPRLAKEIGQSFDTADLVNDQNVTVKVLDQVKGEKVAIVKFKNKTRYTRHLGQRPRLTRVEVMAIGK